MITGSNSKVLSSQLSTLLSGRYVEFAVYPFNMPEYALISGKDPDKNAYMKFLNSGGFPELFHLGNFETKRNYVSSIKDTVLLRDIIQRNNIKDAKLLEDIFGYLVNNASCLVSVNNVVNFFKSKGRKTNYELSLIIFFIWRKPTCCIGRNAIISKAKKLYWGLANIM